MQSVLESFASVILWSLYDVIVFRSPQNRLRIQDYSDTVSANSGFFRYSLREGDTGFDLHLQQLRITQECDGVIQNACSLRLKDLRAD